MRRVMTIAECQDAAFEVAVELARQDKRLTEIASAIQLPPDFDAELLEFDVASYRTHNAAMRATTSASPAPEEGVR